MKALLALLILAPAVHAQTPPAAFEASRQKFIFATNDFCATVNATDNFVLFVAKYRNMLGAGLEIFQGTIVGRNAAGDPVFDPDRKKAFDELGPLIFKDLDGLNRYTSGGIGALRAQVPAIQAGLAKWQAIPWD